MWNSGIQVNCYIELLVNMVAIQLLQCKEQKFKPAKLTNLGYIALSEQCVKTMQKLIRHFKISICHKSNVKVPKK